MISCIIGNVTGDLFILEVIFDMLCEVQYLAG